MGPTKLDDQNRRYFIKEHIQRLQQELKGTDDEAIGEWMPSKTD